MHIVHYYHKPLPVNEYGGVERDITWLIKGLRELGHTVTLIGPKGSSLECNMVSFPGNSQVPAPGELKDYIPKDADILHFHHDGFIDMPVDIPYVTSLYGYGNLKDSAMLDSKYCFLSDAHRRHWNLPQHPFIHSGLDPMEYEFREKKGDYFLFLSRIDWKVKGLDWAIEASKRAGVKLMIAGNTHRKSFVNSYWRGFLKKRLNDQCLYVGPVGGKLKAELLAGAKALIFPTLWPEPFGLVAIESLVSGTPLITTHNGAMPEIVENGKQGFLCSSIDEIVAAIKHAGDINPLDCAKRVDENFHYRRMAELYIDFYKRHIRY